MLRELAKGEALGSIAHRIVEALDPDGQIVAAAAVGVPSEDEAAVSDDSAQALLGSAGCGATYCAWFHVGGVSVRVVGEHSTDLNLDATLQPFRVDSGGSDIDIQIRWVGKL